METLQLKGKRKKIKLARKPDGKLETVSEAAANTQITEVLAQIAHELQGVLDDMHGINVNMYPLKPITKMRWEAAIGDIIKKAIATYRTVSSEKAA